MARRIGELLQVAIRAPQFSFDALAFGDFEIHAAHANWNSVRVAVHLETAGEPVDTSIGPDDAPLRFQRHAGLEGFFDFLDRKFAIFRVKQVFPGHLGSSK